MVINAFNDLAETTILPLTSVSIVTDPLDKTKLGEAEPASQQISELEVNKLLERASRATNRALIRK